MSRQPSNDRLLVKVLTALRAHGGPARSPLYRWMRRHPDTLPPPRRRDPTRLGTSLADAVGDEKDIARRMWR